MPSSPSWICLRLLLFFSDLRHETIMKTAKCGIGGQFSGVSRGRSVIYGNCPPVPLARSARYETARATRASRNAAPARPAFCRSVAICRRTVRFMLKPKAGTARVDCPRFHEGGIFISARLTLDKTPWGSSRFFARRVASQRLFLNTKLSYTFKSGGRIYTDPVFRFRFRAANSLWTGVSGVPKSSPAGRPLLPA